MTKKSIIKAINSNTEWFPKSYAGYLFGIHIQAMGVSNASKKFPFAQRFGLVYINAGKAHWDWFWNSTEMEKSRKAILSRAIRNDKFADNFFNEWLKQYEAFIQHFQIIVESAPETFDNKTTLKQFRKLYDLEVAQTTYGYVVDSFLTSGVDDWLVEIIKKELGSKATSEVVTTLTAPV